MCWKCDHPGGTTEDYLAEMRDTMLEDGWAVQYVESDRMPVATRSARPATGCPNFW
jgi:hypothetical protein